MHENIKIDLNKLANILKDIIIDYKSYIETNDNNVILKFINHKCVEFGIANNKEQLIDAIVNKCTDLACYNIDSEQYKKDIFEINKKELSGRLYRCNILNVFAAHLELKSAFDNSFPAYASKIICRLTHSLANVWFFENNDTINKALLTYAVLLFITDKSMKYKDFELLALIQAGKRLTNINGIKFEINNADIVLEDEQHKKIHNLLLHKISNIGGIDFLQRLFTKELNKTFEPTLNRYLIQKNKTQFLNHLPTTIIPYNYLIALSVKCLCNKNILLTVQGKNQLYEETIQVARDYLTCLNLQKYTAFEDMFREIKDITFELNRNILFDRAFTPLQYNPDFVVLMLETLYNRIENEIENAFEYDSKAYLKFCKSVLQQKNICVCYGEDDLAKCTGLKKSLLTKILDDVSEDYSNINTEFNDIFSKTNYIEKPFVKLSNGKHFFLSPYFNGVSFYHILYNKLSNATPNISNLIGEQVEHIIKTILDNRNIKYHCGKYINPDVTNSECDIVVENDKKIIFIEIKNRPLSKTLEFGEDVDTIKVLSEGMVYAQKQCFTHALNLKKFGSLELLNKGNNSIYTLSQNNRQIFSVSVCLHEYLFLTDKMFSSYLLESLLFVEFHAVNPKEETYVKKLNDVGGKLKNIIHEYYGNKIPSAREVFFDSLFRSANQIFTIAMKSRNTEDFINLLTKSVYISDGTGEIYTLLKT